MQDNDGKQKVAELIKDARIGMLTTMTTEGKHVARPMWLQETEFDGELWFFSNEHSDKASQINFNSEVNVSFSDQKRNNWVSISGMASVVKDYDKMKELWSPMLKAWFPDELETDGICLIKVAAETAEYWDTPNSTAVNLFGMVKATLTGKTPDSGENKTVEL